MYCEGDMISNLSKSVRKLMAERKLSINELAKKTGLTFSVIRNIKDGKVKKVNAHNVFQIASYFHVSPNELLGTKTIPDELKIREERVEFISSFFEKEAGDFLFYNKCGFFDSYDSEYEKCVVASIHSFVEAHKIATGYYHKGFAGKKIQEMTSEMIEKERQEYILNMCFGCENQTVPNGSLECRELYHENEMVSTGMAIKRLRELYGLSRKQLADRTGLGEDCMYRIENGINKKVNFEHLSKISRELLCTSDFLLGESCDPTCNKDGSSLFYLPDKGLEFRYVQLGHDLAYALNYMNSESKDIVINMIKTMNLMTGYKTVHDDSFGERLSIQEVFFREQSLYMEKYRNRGAHFFTSKYSIDEREGGNEDA